MSALKKFFMIFLVLTTIAILSILLFFKLNTSTENFANFSSQPEPTKEQLPTIIIDAGHGGEDGGAIGKNGAYEKDINLMISKKLKALLDAKNIPCVLTRSTDILLYDKTSDYEGKKKKLDLLARKEFAEKYENAIFISIHQNSFSKSQYTGFQVYYSPNEPSSKLLAQSLQSAVKNGLQPNNDRAIKSSTNIYLLDKLFCPAVLIECGFLSNEAECARLCNESYQNALCDILCEAVIEFIK